MPDSSLRLLLIEDNPGDARFIRELLHEATELSRRVGDRAFAQRSGSRVDQSAPTLLHETRLAAGIDRLDEDIDIVLLDLSLPDSDGLDTLTTLLDHTDTPVVVLTGLRDRDTGIEALHQGAQEYLVKDEINSDLLIRSVYQAIERREHKRELRKYETLIEASTDVNAILDPDGTVRYVTPSVEPILGYDPDELVGANVFEYIHPDDRKPTKEAYKKISEGGLHAAEFRFRHADGSWIILEGRGRDLLDDPLIEGVVVYTRDITERKERERKLEEFASVVSHDLRNPLGIAQMYLHMLRTEDDPSHFGEIEQALDRMETIIQNLLLMTREGQTIAETEPIPFSTVIESAWQQVETFDATLRVEDGESTIPADEDRLQAVFENLFRNAVEHGGRDVDVRVGRVDDGFYVEDTGPGVPKEHRPEIFEYGYSEGDGTGIGLAVVRDIVEAHGWDITVTDTTSGGARFEIRDVDGRPSE